LPAISGCLNRFLSPGVYPAAGKRPAQLAGVPQYADGGLSVMNIITTLASFLKLDRLVISLFILLSASAQYFIWTFGVVIDRA
jgi:glucan phosphoethanolaminetransferase (alkaline phosphatase superfamily)